LIANIIIKEAWLTLVPSNYFVNNSKYWTFVNLVILNPTITVILVANFNPTITAYLVPYIREGSLVLCLVYIYIYMHLPLGLRPLGKCVYIRQSTHAHSITITYSVCWLLPLLQIALPLLQIMANLKVNTTQCHLPWQECRHVAMLFIVMAPCCKRCNTLLPADVASHISEGITTCGQPELMLVMPLWTRALKQL